MTPALWALRAVNLLLVLAAAFLGARGKAVSVSLPALAALAAVAASAAAVFSGRIRDAKARRSALAAFCAGDILLVMWTAQWTQQWAGVIDLGVLVPAVVLALEFGAAAGALAAVVPAGFTAFLIATVGPAAEANPELVWTLVLRGLLFALAPAAAGLALGPARSRAAAVARGTIARLRAAQVGEYLSYALFQLRDYAITITSVAEAIALAPKDDPRQAERVERLRKAAGELGVKLSRVLGDQSALTTARPPAAAVDLAGLVGACVDECREAFAPDGVQVSILVQSAPPPVHSERRSIELALLSVLQNSLEACASRGGGAVTVLLRREGANAEIEVSDDGGGVSETDKVTMFEPFVSARRGSHGLGLGLSMSRRFLERIGGGLKVKSKGGYTAALLVVPLERELPKIRLEDSTWAGRRAEQRS
ncbi:MAG: HAMP domain-containing histidine kinase [Elusimicrobia bacterium]|nr:HAMP domain-containing histidine kinase [Elusimicrobiota bacterium]